MKRKGKLLALCLTLVLTLTACGSKTDNKKSGRKQRKRRKESCTRRTRKTRWYIRYLYSI